MKVINGFLAVNPVYKLNMNDPKVALLSKLPLDMKVALLLRLNLQEEAHAARAAVYNRSSSYKSK